MPSIAVAPERLPGWLNRFGAQHGGLGEISCSPVSVIASAGDGTEATFSVPYAPMAAGDLEPVEALLAHLARLGTLGLVLVRAGAYSIGTCRDRAVLTSSTDRQYVQGRTAAGGSSQQRFARRRANQRRASAEHARDAVLRVLGPQVGVLDALVLGGDRFVLASITEDRRLAQLVALPSRSFFDIPEPRRAVLDDVAARSLDVPVTISSPAERSA